MVAPVQGKAPPGRLPGPGGHGTGRSADRIIVLPPRHSIEPASRQVGSAPRPGRFFGSPRQANSAPGV